MLHKGSRREFHRVLKAQESVKVIKQGQLVKFFGDFGIVLDVEVLKFLRIVNTFKQPKEQVEEVDYKSPYSVIVLASSGDIIKIMDRDIEYI
jgi:hypothetical protein